jgi:REP element-mobilizing transposase RayT
MRHRIYCHIVWRTKGNAEVIDADLARFLCRFFRAAARREQARVLEIGLVRDHVHMVVRAHPGASVSRLVQRCKGGSSYLAGKERTTAPGAVLRWAKGYTVESVSPRALTAARAYVRGQPSHHPALAIPGWEGDTPQYDATGLDEWVGPERFRVRGSPTKREPDAPHQFTG